MQFNKNNPQKRRKLWEQINTNEINISDLKKAGVKVRSLIYDKGIYTYKGKPTDECQSWLGLYPFADITVYELKEFTEEMIPYLDSQLITKIAEDSEGNPNQELLESLEAKFETQDYWQYAHVIKAEEDDTSSFAQEYKVENGSYPVTYYLISYIVVQFYENETDKQVLDYKQVITINNPKFDEITKDKK